MEFTHFVKLAPLFIILLLLFLWCWNYRKKVAGFPNYYIIPRIVKWLLTGKITKDTPLNHVLFEELIQVGKRYLKEGCFMLCRFQPILYIFSPEAIKFFANEQAALNKSSDYKLLEESVGAGLITSNGERWKTHRKLINPAFHMRVLKEKVPIFNEHAMNLVKDMEKLVDKSSVDILDILKAHYFNALSESILGLKQDKGKEENFLKFAEIVDNISNMIVRRAYCPWLYWKFLLNFSPSGRTYLRENKEGCNFINETISNMKTCILSNKNENGAHFGNHLRKSFTSILLNHHLNNPSTFTFQDLHDEVKTVMTAGYHSVTYTTIWCLSLLGMHPEIQERLFHEIELGTSDYVTYEEASNLNYLEAVILETLRIYPTVPIFLRELTEDVQFGKYKVFKGTMIAFLIHLTNRSPEIYSHPEKFDPERFLNPELKKNRSFIPFSEGVRSCIGKNYALIEIKIFLAHILRNFEIVCLDTQEDVKLCWSIVLSPVKPLRFKITKRSDTNLQSP